MKAKVRSLAFLILLVASFATNSLKAQSISATVQVQPCNNNGQIGVTVTGLTPPINYTYSNSNWGGIVIVHTNINSLSDVVTGLPAYQAVQWGGNPNGWFITASSGAVSTQTQVWLTPPFQDSIHVLNAVCPAQCSLTAMQFVGGTAPFTCVWTNTSTSQSYTGNPAPVPNGIYTVVITDAGGCMVSSAPSFSGGVIYANSQSNILVNTNGTMANCTNGTASITASGGTAPYTYLWSNNAVTQNISGLTQGQYNCVVTDALGCQSTGWFNVQQAVTINYNSSITNANCLQANGSILSFVSGGTLPYSFSWNNAATTQNISNLATGQYIVLITDANGCTRTGYAFVGSSTPISVTYTSSPSSCTAPSGSATLTPTGGLAPYSVVWNTFPNNATGLSISNRPAGNYFFTVTDANGCVKTGSAFIPPASTLTAILNNAVATCPSTIGNLQVSVSGSNPPFTYSWSNLATTSNIIGVPLGSYQCVVTDALSCSVTKYASITQSSPLSVAFSPTAASCVFTNDGAVTATAFGGTAPYTYTWNVPQAGPTASGLSTGWYSVNVTDANGCHNNYNSSMVLVGYNATNTSCYCTITGTVFADGNLNCVQNAGENGIANIQIHCNPFGFAYTNSNGVYSFNVPSGTYTITEAVQPFYPIVPCQTNNQVIVVTAGVNCSSIVNFANSVVPVHDLRIVTLNHNFPVPGNVYQQRIIVHNDGTLTENNIKIGYKHDGQLTYSNSTNWNLTQQNPVSYPNWYSVTSGFPNLIPGANSSTFLNYAVPPNIPMSTQVNFKDTTANAAPITTNWLLDSSPWNNKNDHAAIVVSSYDPNFKEVSPKGSGAQGNITVNDSILTFVVHFQNEGTYYAQNIVVVDTLDADLNIASLRPGYSDHNFEVTIGQNRVMKYTFKNIQLPWKSSFGNVLSSGLFSYSIKLKSNLPLGTQIKNTAAIYFDYNEPIITNTTWNTIAEPVFVSEVDKRDLSHQLLFPNPATNRFNVLFNSIENSKGTLQIFDISGREVLNHNVEVIAGENNLSENVSQLQNGVYFVQVIAEQIKFTKKLIISK